MPSARRIPRLDADGSNSPVSSSVAAVARIGSFGFAVAVGLVVLGFLTNPEPYPYYDWATLPVTPLPEQPRLGHYPATITLGTWLWEFTFPLALIWLVDRYGLGSNRARTVVFLLVPAVYALGFHLYCRFVFPQPDPTLWEPAVTAVCYVYCQTYDLSWSYVTLGTVALGTLGMLLPDRSTASWVAIVAFGVLTFPLGIAPLYEAALRRSGRSTNRRASRSTAS